MAEAGETALPTRPAKARAGWAGDQLLASAQRGDVEAISAVVSGAHPHVRRFAHSLCASPQDAEDAAQEALLILYRKMGSLRASAALSSWMFRIVRNECLRWSRRLLVRHRSDRYEMSLVESSVESAEDQVLSAWEADRVAAVVAALPPLQRRVLIMRDIQGLPGRTVAESLGLSSAAMKSHLHRGRLAVRAGLLKADGWGPESFR